MQDRHFEAQGEQEGLCHAAGTLGRNAGRVFACTLPLVGEGGRLFHAVALMAMARGMAGRKDKPLVAIEFAEERVRHEVAA